MTRNEKALTARVLVALLIAVALLVVSVVTSDAAPEGALHVIVHSESDEEGTVTHRTMEVQNPAPTLSSMSSVDGDTAYVRIWSYIRTGEASDFYGDSLLFVNKYDVKKVIVIIGSPGGSAFAGIGIADTILSLKRQGIATEGHALGSVCSAAVPILAACEKRYALGNCLFMVHRASLSKYFSKESIKDIRSQQNMLEMLSERYIDILVRGSNLTAEEWEEKEKATTWFTPEEAMEWGLIHEIR